MAYNACMKLLVSLLTAMLLASTASAAPDWSDEFDGDALDLTKWSLPWKDRYGVVNQLQNAQVYDGCLHIKTKTDKGKLTSAMLTTQGSLEKAYGYWEIKCKFGDDSGTWSDAWLFTEDMVKGVDDLDKFGAEVDIFEHRLFDGKGEYIPHLISHGVHWNGYDWPKHHNSWGLSELQKWNDWHVFGLYATPEKYQFIIDGVVVGEVHPTTKHPLFLVLSTEILDKGWAGKKLKEYDHETLTIDYVRYYTAKPR